jgi:hypothetical protein
MKVLAVLLSLAAVLRAPQARAQERGEAQADALRRVVVLSVEHDPQLRARLAAELRAQGFEPVEAAVGAELVLRVDVAATAIHLWIANASTGRKIEREAPVTEGSPPDSAIVSLWAVEALRASSVAPAPVPRVEAVTAAPAPAPAARLFALHLAPAVTFGSGGVGSAVQVMIGARRLISRRVGAELSLNLPTLPTRVERTTGSALVSQGMAAAGTFLSVGGAEPRWSAQLGAGAALTLVRVSGAGANGYLGRVDQLAAGGPYARLGGAVRLSQAFRLRLDGVAGLLFPQPAIYFADDRVAAWGRPWLAVALGGEALF